MGGGDGGGHNILMPDKRDHSLRPFSEELIFVLLCVRVKTNERSFEPVCVLIFSF